MKYTRRHFIKTGLVGLGGLTLSGNLLPSCTQTKSLSSNFYNPFDTVTLGKTGIKASRMCMGTGIKAGSGHSNLTRLGFENGVEFVKTVYERGVRMFDCADSYGSHFIIAEAMKGKKRTDHVIFSKVWFQGVRDLDIDKTVERFLKELQTDYLDGLQMHCATAADWTSQYSELMQNIDKLKQQGLIRSHGVSCHSIGALKAAAESPWVDTCHVRINPFGVNMDGSIEEVFPIVQSMHKAGKSVIGIKIFGEGKFADDPDKKNESLTFALRSGVVDIINIGMDKLSDLEDTAERIRNISVKA